MFHTVFKYFQVFSGNIDLCMHGNLKSCLKKISRLLLHQTIVLLQTLLIHHSKIALNFEENCLKQDTITFNHRNVVNLFFVYKLDIWLSDLCTDFTLKGCLFGAVKLTRKADPDKYFYSGYVTRIDSLSHFLISNLDFGNYF